MAQTRTQQSATASCPRKHGRRERNGRNKEAKQKTVEEFSKKKQNMTSWISIFQKKKDQVHDHFVKPGRKRDRFKSVADETKQRWREENSVERREIWNEMK